MKKTWMHLLLHSRRVASNFLLLALILGLGVAACLQAAPAPSLVEALTFSGQVNPEKLITTPVTYFLGGQ